MKNLLFILGLIILPLVLSSCNDDDDDKQIVYEQLPVVAQSFLETHFPNDQVRYIEEDNDGYDVYLENNYEVDFDKQGDWKSIDGNYKQLPESIFALIPVNSINEYITKMYPEQFITEIEKDRSKNGYEIKLNNRLELIFNTDGTFRGIDR